MSGFRLKVMSMRKDLLDPTNQGEFLVLEQKKEKTSSIRSLFAKENVLLAFGFVLLIVIGVAWIVVILKK